MKNAKKKFPFAEGWLHAKLTLVAGHGLTTTRLIANFRGMGASQFGHIAITGNRALVIYREAKHVPPPVAPFNHFCPGESGMGEYCHRSTEVPSKCHYCGEPNEALIQHSATDH